MWLVNRGLLLLQPPYSILCCSGVRVYPTPNSMAFIMGITRLITTRYRHLFFMKSCPLICHMCTPKLYNILYLSWIKPSSFSYFQQVSYVTWLFITLVEKREIALWIQRAEKVCYSYLHINRYICVIIVITTYTYSTELWISRLSALCTISLMCNLWPK